MAQRNEEDGRREGLPVTRHLGRCLTRLIVLLVLLGYLVVVVFPMVWLCYTSLKPDQDIFLRPFDLPKAGGVQWVNFSNAWSKARFGDYFLNSVLVAAATVPLVVLVASMAAYALARFAFPGARPLLFYFLAGLMVPLQLAIVPLFFQMKTLHLLNSRVGLVIAYVAFGMPFAVFVLTGFFRSLPSSLHEAARIDGAGELRTFWSVMLPLARPALFTVAIFSFISTWNEFFMAFMFLSGQDSERVRTLPLGMANVMIVSQYRADWGAAFAGLVMMMLVTLVVYILLQRHLVKGVTLGALKG